MAAASNRDPGEYFVELADRNLTDAERYAFGISDVQPLRDLQQHNADLACPAWTGTPKPGAPAPLCYPSPLQARVPVQDELPDRTPRAPRPNRETPAERERRADRRHERRDRRLALILLLAVIASLPWTVPEAIKHVRTSPAFGPVEVQP